MKSLIELIKLIFGPKALSKTIGTRTNVIKLPNNKTKRYTKQDLDIESASDAAAMNAKKEMEELIAEIPKMNDAERLVFEGNLRRLKNRLGIRSETDPTADVFEFGTKEQVTPGGIASLTEKAGQKSPPGTIMGNIESRLNKLRASGEDPSTMKGQTLEDIMTDALQSKGLSKQMYNEGLVRATARDIITNDIKSGKLKLPKELEQQILEGGGEPIDVLRNVYGEDALEVLDSLIPEFSKLRTSTEAEKLARSKFKFEPDVNRPRGSVSLEEGAKAEQEYMLTPEKTIPADSPEGKKITETLIGKPKAKVTELLTAEKIIADMNKMDPMDAMYEANKVLKKEGKYKNLKDEDVQKIMSETEDSIFERNFPEEPEDFATGGRVGFNEGSKLTDYIKTNISASTSSSSPEEGVKIKEEILDGIVSLNIPLNKKLKLLGDLKFGKNRAKVDLSELGKKYGIDLGEEVYKDKYFSPGLGAEYTTDEGTKFNFMVNPEDKGGSVSVSRSFATGGRVGYSDGTKPSAAENTPSQEIINRMIAQIKQLSKRGVDVSTIKDIVGASDQMIKDVLGQASGGRIGFQRGTSKIYDQLEHKVPFPHAQDVRISSKGLDYLTGTERRGYAQGTLLSQYQKHLSDITGDPLQSTVIPSPYIIPSNGGDSSMSFTTPTKEQSEYAMDQGMTDVGENRFGGLGSMVMGGLISAINPVLGIAYSLANPNSITRQALASIGFNPTTEGSINGPFGGYGGFDGTEGSFGSVDTQAQSEASMSEGMSDVGDSSGGVDSAGDGGDGYATGGRVKYSKGGLNYLMGY